MPVIQEVVSDNYALYNGDCVQVMRDLPQDSMHLAITSIPFSSLYSYTDSVFDASNTRTEEDFWRGMGFVFRELYRVMMPGRIVVTHCMDLPATLERDGYIGIKDFSGDLIRELQRAGFLYHSPRVMIWKDPLIAATRTHAIGLSHKQLVKDSSLSRQGIADWLIVMRKPGGNPEPITHKPSGLDRWIGDPTLEPKSEKRSDPALNKYSHHIWQQYASMAWFDINPSDTLQRQSAREDDDSRHICPLQLTVIRRAIELWSNPGDVVLDPFGGIGSSGYVALQEGRKCVMSELKESYFNQMCRNLESARVIGAQPTLFSTAHDNAPSPTESNPGAGVALQMGVEG